MGKEQKLTRIGTIHSKLSRRVKEYEQTVEIMPPMEVLNEMRYALRALLELWDVDHKDEVDTQAFAHAEERTYHALVCAYHDLVDGVVIDLTTSLDQMTKQFPEAAFEVLGTLRIEILDALNEVDEEIAKSREDISLRQGIYENNLYDQWYAKILQYRKTLTRTVLPEIVEKQKKLEEQKWFRENKERMEKRRWLIALFVGVASVVLGVAALI